jgi:hypothetical protein
MLNKVLNLQECDATKPQLKFERPVNKSNYYVNYHIYQIRYGKIQDTNRY